MNQTLNIKQISMVILLVVITIMPLSMMGVSINTNTRATLIFPRFGSAIRGPPTAGPGLNKTNFLNDTITFYVAPDPASSPIPPSWLVKENWNVALVPSVMPTANCTKLVVDSVYLDKNKDVLFGGYLDVNPLYPTSVAIKCKIPADISPLLFNLAIGFKIKINPEKQHDGSIDLSPSIGSWEGPRGSASVIPPNSGAFLLKEENVVSLPWIHDAFTFDSNVSLSTGQPVKPFTVMHVTDPHYNENNKDWLLSNSLWENDSLVIAPDLVILSGDVMEDPGNERVMGAHEYNFAYNRLSRLHLPFIIVPGNHDNKNLGPWKHYFGPLFSSLKYDHLKIVGIDNILPLDTGILNWIDSTAKPVVKGGPVFLTAHYNIDPSYFQSGWLGLGNIMIKRNITAILVGHTHVDLVGSVKNLWNAMYSNIDKLLTGKESEFEQILSNTIEISNASTGYLGPINEPQIMMTRTAGKQGGLAVGIDGFNSTLLNYSGYRILTIENDKVFNYTYDLDGDGIREPQVSYPVGLFNYKTTFDANIGVSLNANATWTLNNTSNEDLRSARAVFLLPAPPAGAHWALTAENQTSGAYIRAQVTNGTHYWIDARVPAPRQRTTSLVITPVTA
ncbi:MAG: metallophosphoesterase family protein [Promethearchaeota archaeon]